MSPQPKPWHDTPRHLLTQGDGERCDGPVVAFNRFGYLPPYDVADVRHVRCAACGEDWLETDLPTLVRVWWSEGAAAAAHELGKL